MEYEYICRKCKKTFSVIGNLEVLVGLHPSCPDCKTPRAIKKISIPNFILKGKGFYKNDAAKSKNK